MIKSFLIAILSFSSWGWSLSIDMDKALQTARNSAVQNPIKQNTSSIKVLPKKIPYVILFNHREKSPLKAQDSSEKETAKKEILSHLISFLTNNEHGSKEWFEYVSQEENDLLLKQIITAQLKQSDLNVIFKEYTETALSEIQKQLPSDTVSQRATINEVFQDGKRVLKAFISVQSRIEQIESNLWETSKLANPDLRKIYAGKTFQCFYSLYTKENLEYYKAQTIEEHQRFIRDQETFVQEMKQKNFDMDSDLTLIKDFRKRFLDHTNQELEVINSNDIKEKEVKALLQGSWSQRMIVARCLQIQVVKKHKEVLLKRFNMSAQAESLSPREIDVLLNSNLLKKVP